MVVVRDEAVAVAVALVEEAGLRPRVKPVEGTVVAAAVVVAEAAGVVAAPRGLSVKARPPAAAVVVAVDVIGAKVATVPKVKLVLAVVVAVAVAVAMGVAKSEEPEIVAVWVETGGAGVDEGLIPKANPPP